MSPLFLEVLMHCYVSPSPHRNTNAPAVVEVLEKLHNMGAIEKLINPDCFTTTALGRAWIGQILDTPCPEVAFLCGVTGAIIGREKV